MQFAPHTRLGPYELLEALGAGGMGEVWKARDTRLDRIVAIKRLSDKYSQRFEQEARAIAALNHPHICQIYDIGPDYLVLEFIDGKPLRGPIALEDALRVAIQIASALDTAHAKNILHRDLKPANILMTANGAKLLDFGLARLVAPSDETQTLTETLAGTPAYMSPEQIEGKTLDARSDIFSFGSVLYEMLSGRRPFDGLAAVLRDEPTPLNSSAASIVARCLAKRPSERFQSIAEVRAALEEISAAPKDSRPSIAVLPFANLSGDREQEYFSDGLAEEVLNAVAKIPGLKVIARTSAFAFKGRNEDIRRIAEALGVGNVLEGSVRRSGNRVRITAQLIDASDGSHLWSDRYDREMADVFAVQDEIAAAIARALHAKLGATYGHSGRPPENPEAYQAYLEGRYHMHKVTPRSMAQALECYQRAIRLDPTYALPHVGLAEGIYYQSIYLGGRPRDIVPAALDSLARALQLNTMTDEAHLARGIFSAFYEYDWKAAGEHYVRALELNPMFGRARASRSIWYLLPVRRPEEALDEARRAVYLDPLNPAVRNTETWVLHVMRREEAIERARAALQLFSSSWISNFIAAHVFIRHELYEEAVSALESGLEVVPHSVYLLGVLALARGGQRKPEEAERIRAALEARAAQQYVPFLPRSYASEACGDVEEAHRLFDRAVEEREPLAVPVLADRRAGGCTDPRLQALLQKMNLA
jgi:eukaryotic-like serine/threonine-protein kinase